MAETPTLGETSRRIVAPDTPIPSGYQNRSGCPYRSGKQKQDRSNNFRLVLFGVVIFPLPKGIRSNLRLTNTYSRRRRPDCFP